MGHGECVMWGFFVVVGVPNKPFHRQQCVPLSGWVSCRDTTTDSGAVRIPFCHYCTLFSARLDIMRTFSLGTVRYGTVRYGTEQHRTHRKHTHIFNIDVLYVYCMYDRPPPKPHTKKIDSAVPSESGWIRFLWCVKKGYVW